MSKTEPRQATCVLLDGRAILIEGEPGSGKTSLALALIEQGGMLVGDDGVTLGLREGRVWAFPPPNTAGLIEVRNVGIARLPCGEGPVALVLRLDPLAPRYIEEAGSVDLLGQAIPQIALYPDTPALAIRAMWALRLHGLRRDITC
jgi:serine kinase of HPr protein (carbohydrate metabolism regulator)